MTAAAITAIGVDVGSRWVHVVGLDATATVCVRERFAANGPELDALLRSLPPHRSVAIDGPAGPSANAYADDLTIAPKFRPARGSEVELGRQRRIWVPWVTGPAPLTGWMAVAASIHVLATKLGHVALETYPHAVFTTLHGRRPPTKSTADGRAVRAAILREHGLVGGDDDVTAWTHDELDAGAAALVAWRHVRGEAVAITSERDGTNVWLPA